MAELRPLTEASGGTCDWGDCNQVAVEERHDPVHGWLPVCERHTGRDRGPQRTCWCYVPGHIGDPCPLHSRPRSRAVPP